MSARVSLPVRLIRSQRPGEVAHNYKYLKTIESNESLWLGSDKNNNNIKSINDRFMSAYKPSGLPYFARSQLNYFSASRELFTLPSLRAIRNSELSYNKTEDNASPHKDIHLFPQPSDDDNSDALLTRVKDACAPGRNTPYVAIPVPSELLFSATTHSANQVTSHSASTSSPFAPRSIGVNTNEREKDENHNNSNSDNDITNEKSAIYSHSIINTALTSAPLTDPISMNNWTARWKGLTLLASDVATTSILRNCAAMNLVITTYHVLCRLPPHVSSHITKHFHNANASLIRRNKNNQLNDKKIYTNDDDDDDDDDDDNTLRNCIVSLASSNSNKNGKLTNKLQSVALQHENATQESHFLNPYVKEFITTRERRESDINALDKNEIPLYDPVTGKLPNDLVIEPLLSIDALHGVSNNNNIDNNSSTDSNAQYGFVNYERNTLYVNGKVSCFLRSRAAHMSRELDMRVNQRRRLQGLFLPTTLTLKQTVNINSTNKNNRMKIDTANEHTNHTNNDIHTNTRGNSNSSSSSSSVNIESKVKHDTESNRHPWLPESSLFTLSLDVASRRKGAYTAEHSLANNNGISSHNSTGNVNSTGVAMERGKHVAFNFRLLTIAPSLDECSDEHHHTHKNVNDNTVSGVCVDTKRTNDETLQRVSPHNTNNNDNTNTWKNISNIDTKFKKQEEFANTLEFMCGEELPYCCPNCCWALYEVTGNAITPDEIAAVFAAQHFFVLNDYVNDLSLAKLINYVAQHIRSTSVARLAADNLPLKLQHFIKNGSVEELVILPLLQQPLETAARCLSHVSQLSEILQEELCESSFSSSASEKEEEEEEEGEEEDKEHSWKYRNNNKNNTKDNKNFTSYKSAKSKNQLDKFREEKSLVVRDSMRTLPTTPRTSLHAQLLDEALQLKRNYFNEVDVKNKKFLDNNDKHNYNNSLNNNESAELLLQLLPLGSGIECVQMTFPDPTLQSNLIILQNLFQSFQSSNKSWKAVNVAQGAEELLFVTHGTNSESNTLSIKSINNDSSENGNCTLPVLLGKNKKVLSEMITLDEFSTTCKQRNNENNNNINTNNNTIDKNLYKAASLISQFPLTQCSLSLAIPLLVNLATWCGKSWLVNKLRNVNTSESYSLQWHKWIREVEGLTLTSLENCKETNTKSRMSEHEHSQIYSNSTTTIYKLCKTFSSYIRLEELSEHVCPLCHESSHTWRSCPLYHASFLPLENSEINQKTLSSKREMSTSSTTDLQSQQTNITPSSTSFSSLSPSSSIEQTEQSKSSANSNTKFRLITDGKAIRTLHDVAHKLTSLASNDTRHNSVDYAHKTHFTRTSHTNVTTSYSGSTIISVPDKAVTMTLRQNKIDLNKYYREQSNRYTPRLHRPVKVVRCVYCGGKHHVSECSKLDKQIEQDERTYN